MATKKTASKKKTTSAEKTAPKTTTKTATETKKNPSTYRSGDITRLSVISLMLGIIFILGLLLGLGLGAKVARRHVANKIENSDSSALKQEIKDEVLAEIEEARPNIPAPQQEAPVVDTIENETSVETPDVDEDAETAGTTVPAN